MRNPAFVPSAKTIATLCCFAALAPHAGAVVVTIVADLPAERHFISQRLYWERELGLLRESVAHEATLVRQGAEAAAVAGDPRVLSRRVAGPASVLNSFTIAARLPAVADTLSEARPADALTRRMIGYHEGRRSVGATYTVPEGEERRDAWLYADLAREDAVRARFERAVANLDEVEARETRVQRELHARLRASPTAAEVELVHTALAAAGERAAYARSQMERARAELETVRETRLADEERIRRARTEEELGRLRGLDRGLERVGQQGGLR